MVYRYLRSKGSVNYAQGKEKCAFSYFCEAVGLTLRPYSKPQGA